jgi:FlaA1/EpsC-like NDP-sugar epimerase
MARQVFASCDNVFIFSRNEKSQVEMKREFPKYNYIIGDVREQFEVLKSVQDMDYVYHFAALKHVDICEKQPQEAVRTNIMGTLNVINACLYNKCRMINMSSDKANNPVNVYGISKFVAEKMVLQSGFINIQSGNVLWSSGSVLPIWITQLKQKNEINLTSKEMTRFFIHAKDLVGFILKHKDAINGTYTVTMKSFRLYDIAQEFIKRFGNIESKINITGLRFGERLHEFKDATISSEYNICNDLNYIFQ